MKNTLKTTMLLATMGALIMFISSFWGSGGLTIGLFLALAMVGGSYWMSDKLAIRSARAVEVEEGQLPEYWTIMKELCELSGQPMPRIYVSPDPQPNAFATGRNPRNAAVCITEGLMQHLAWSEIRGVLAFVLLFFGGQCWGSHILSVTLLGSLVWFRNCLITIYFWI